MNRRQAIKTVVSLAAAPAMDVLALRPSLATARAFPELVPLPPSPKLSDPLTFRNGVAVRTAQAWERRRLEILETARLQMYGVMPPPTRPRFVMQERDGDAFGGLAQRMQVKVLFKGDASGPAGNLLLYIPRKARRAPVILGLNFWGNQAVSPDPVILLNENWVESGKNPFLDLSCVANHRSTQGCRGIDARRWPLELILKRGYALATMYRGDIDPDVADGSVPGLRNAYPELQKRGDNFSAIAAWAWALSRSLDYLETDPRVDARRVAAYGWSRLGKAALWAGACDRRFAAVISQESGAGGAKLFRRDVGEDIHHLNTVFPHWFCRNFKNYDGMDRELPFDQHLILSAIAPRPLAIGSAAGDTMADPEGEFTSAVLASAVYRFLGFSGLNATIMPKAGQVVPGRINYHLRAGVHDVEEIDWERYLDFLDANLRPPHES